MILQTLKQLCAEHNITINGDHITFDKNTTDFQITANFRLHEFLTKNQKDSTTIINLNIVVELQQLRTIFGSPVRISSSYRSPSYNKSVSGGTSSQHILGNALDTFPVNGDIKGWTNTVVKNKKVGGVGTYRTFVHIDSGRTRSWKG